MLPHGRRRLHPAWAKSTYRYAFFVPIGVCIWLTRLLGRDVRPLLSILAVEHEPLLETGLGVGLDRVDGALGLAHPAVDALVGVEMRMFSPW